MLRHFTFSCIETLSYIKRFGDQQRKVLFKQLIISPFTIYHKEFNTVDLFFINTLCSGPVTKRLIN